MLKLTGFYNVMPTLVALTLMYINDGAISSVMSNAVLVIVKFRGLVFLFFYDHIVLTKKRNSVIGLLKANALLISGC